MDISQDSLLLLDLHVKLLKSRKHHSQDVSASTLLFNLRVSSVVQITTAMPRNICMKTPGQSWFCAKIAEMIRWRRSLSIIKNVRRSAREKVTTSWRGGIWSRNDDGYSRKLLRCKNNGEHTRQLHWKQLQDKVSQEGHIFSSQLSIKIIFFYLGKSSFTNAIRVLPDNRMEKNTTTESRYLMGPLFKLAFVHLCWQF